MARGQLDGLLAALDAVVDPRDPRGRRFRLPVVLALALLATCCGARTFVEIAEVSADLDDDLLDAVGVVRATPSAATFCRIAAMVDPDQLDRTLSSWARPAARMTGSTAVALDGKTMRGARTTDSRGRRLQVQVVAAYDHAGSVLGQVQVAGGDENGAVRDLIARLGPDVLAGLVVTVDAKHTGAAFAATTEAAGGRWLIPVKGNQPHMYETLRRLPWHLVRGGDLTRDRARGRAETRTLKVLALDLVDDFGLGARQAIRIQRWTRCAGRVHRETVYYLTSLPPAAAGPVDLAALVRGHWGIENGLHHVRDLAFDEDRHTAHTGHGPVNLACLRNTAITLHRHAGARWIRPALRATARRTRRLTDLLPA